jgi:hypothetical protein
MGVRKGAKAAMVLRARTRCYGRTAPSSLANALSKVPSGRGALPCARFRAQGSLKSRARPDVESDPAREQRPHLPAAPVARGRATGRRRQRSGHVSARTRPRGPRPFQRAPDATPRHRTRQRRRPTAPGWRRRASTVAAERRCQPRACLARRCAAMPSLISACSRAPGRPSGNSAACTLAIPCAPALRTVDWPATSCHSMIEPGPGPRCRRTSAGTEIRPRAVSFE